MTTEDKIFEQVKRIADAMVDLNIFMKALAINFQLLMEDKGDTSVASLDGNRESKKNPLSDSQPLPVVKEVEPLKTKVVETITTSKKAKYTWYKLVGGGKVRRCSNEGCDMFLKFNEDTGKYQHWKYDVNTGVGSYVQDKCDFYGG